MQRPAFARPLKRPAILLDRASPLTSLPRHVQGSETHCTFLLPDFIELPRRFQQLQLRLLFLEICIQVPHPLFIDRKSTRLNSSHVEISYAVFCLKKKNTEASSLV